MTVGTGEFTKVVLIFQFFTAIYTVEQPARNYNVLTKELIEAAWEERSSGVVALSFLKNVSVVCDSYYGRISLHRELLNKTNSTSQAAVNDEARRRSDSSIFSGPAIRCDLKTDPRETDSSPRQHRDKRMMGLISMLRMGDQFTTPALVSRDDLADHESLETTDLSIESIHSSGPYDDIALLLPDLDSLSTVARSSLGVSNQQPLTIRDYEKACSPNKYNNMYPEGNFLHERREEIPSNVSKLACSFCRRRKIACSTKDGKYKTCELVFLLSLFVSFTHLSVDRVRVEGFLAYIPLFLGAECTHGGLEEAILSTVYQKASRIA